MNDEDKTPQEPRPEEPGTAETEEMRDRAGAVGPSPAPSVDPNRRRFLRSSDDRIIAGVAGGLGNYFDIDPMIIRIAFAVSVLFGGLGILAYLAIAVFVPADDGTGAPVESKPVARRPAGRWSSSSSQARLSPASAALAAAAAFATGVGFGLPVAALVVVIGIALAVMSFRGGARWLIVPALALTLGVGVASAADLDLEGGIGDRDYRPASVGGDPRRRLRARHRPPRGRPPRHRLGAEAGHRPRHPGRRRPDGRRGPVRRLRRRRRPHRRRVSSESPASRRTAADVDLATGDGARGRCRSCGSTPTATSARSAIVNDDDADIDELDRIWDEPVRDPGSAACGRPTRRPAPGEPTAVLIGSRWSRASQSP